MKFLVLAVSALLVSSPLHAQSIGEKSGLNSALGLAPKTQDFVTEAAQGDMAEIALSQAAVQKGSDRVKSFAAQMITDHQKTSADLKKLAQTADANLPADMTTSQQKEFEKVAGLRGADFDRQYMDQQVSAHKAAVSLFERYAKGGEHAELQNWARQMLPTLQRHLQMAQALDSEIRK